MQNMKELKPYYTRKNHYVGTISVSDGLIDIMDPGYDEPNWCSMRDVKIKSGKYKCYIDVVNFPYERKATNYDVALSNYKIKCDDILKQDDKRIMSLTIIHEDYADNTPYIANKRWTVLSKDIGVDAGLCGFYNHKPNFSKEDEWSNFWQNLKKIDKLLECDTTKANGITVCSGFGDGLYTVKQIKEKKNIIGLKLLF